MKKSEVLSFLVEELDKGLTMIKKSEIIETIMEALLQIHHYGGALDEREEFRQETKMQRLQGAVPAFEALDVLGLLEYEDDCEYKES